MPDHRVPGVATSGCVGLTGAVVAGSIAAVRRSAVDGTRFERAASTGLGSLAVVHDPISALGVSPLVAERCFATKFWMLGNPKTMTNPVNAPTIPATRKLPAVGRRRFAPGAVTLLRSRADLGAKCEISCGSDHRSTGLLIKVTHVFD